MCSTLQRVCFVLLVILMNIPTDLDAKVMRKKRKRRLQGQSQVLKKKRRKYHNNTPQITCKEAVPEFSKTICRFFEDHELSDVQKRGDNHIVWTKEATDPFGELIVSWNALRPSQGYIAIWVSVLHHGNWSSWHRLAVWGRKLQKTFLHKTHPIVHTLHSRVELQNGNLARGFKIKVTFHKGAKPPILKALFGCISRLNQHKIIHPDQTLPTAIIKKGHTKISQFMLNHERKKDICSPVSTAMMVSYFHQKQYGTIPHHSMPDYALSFAHNVLDQSYLNIFGNWMLNTAHAFDAMNGEVYFSVQRLNSFYDLHHYISNKIPVVVSVRRLPGGATPYAGGHLLMVTGWNSETKSVICIDPAFSPHHATLKSYPLMHFIRAWGRSSNLSYVPMLKSMLTQKRTHICTLEKTDCTTANNDPLLALSTTDLLSTDLEQLDIASLQSLPISNTSEEYVPVDELVQT